MKSINFFGSYSSGFQPYIIKVNSGASGEVAIPTRGVYTYDYDVRVQETSQSFTNQTGDLTITFPATNTDYVIEIRGVFPEYEFNNGDATNRAKMLDVIQCGDIEVLSLLGAFSSLPNCTWSATDFMNTDNCIILAYSFNNSPLINPDLSGCDLSNILTLQHGFLSASSMDKPFIHPETSLLINISNCFQVNKIPVIELGAQSLSTFNSFSINSTYITRFIVYGMKNSFSIQRATNVVGSEIDNMFTELDTANVGATLTVTTAQSTSGIDTTIATNKGWTIVIV